MITDKPPMTLIVHEGQVLQNQKNLHKIYGYSEISVDNPFVSQDALDMSVLHLHPSLLSFPQHFVLSGLLICCQ